MRAKQFFAIVMASIVAAVPAAAQDFFEGTIGYRISGMGAASEMVHHVRGDKIRMELTTPMGPTVMIVDQAAESMLMVMPDQKMFMKMDMKMMAAMAEQMQPTTNEPTELDLTATGRKETIAGHECEHYVMKYQDTEVDFCAAHGLGFYMGSNRGMSGPGAAAQQRGMGGLSQAQAAALRARFKNGFLPLRTQVGDMVMEVTSIEKKRISDDLFEVPAGYSEMRTPR